MHPAQIKLPLARYRAVFTADSGLRFAEFPGSAWRGAIGHALKRTVCVTRLRTCADCLLYRSCVFPYFYDTPPPLTAAKMRRYTTAPHPFVLEPGTGAGEYRLGLTLIGHANRHLPVLLHALGEAAGGPKGVARSTLDLLRIEQEEVPGTDAWQPIQQARSEVRAAAPCTPPVPPLPAGAIAIEIATPLRVKRDGRHVGPSDFRFADLFANLLRRISMLMEFHTDTPLEADFAALSAAARCVRSRVALEWRDLTRYSARQQAAMKLGGVLGRIEVDAGDIEPFWPFLWIGQWVHAGSGATMGLGRYTIEAASLPARRLSPQPPHDPNP